MSWSEPWVSKRRRRLSMVLWFLLLMMSMVVIVIWLFVWLGFRPMTLSWCECSILSRRKSSVLWNISLRRRMPGMNCISGILNLIILEFMNWKNLLVQSLRVLSLWLFTTILLSHYGMNDLVFALLYNAILVLCFNAHVRFFRLWLEHMKKMLLSNFWKDWMIVIRPLGVISWCSPPLILCQRCW